MFKAIWSCIKRVVRSVTGALGTLSTAIGAVSEWLQHPIVVPGWVWITAGAILLFATACRIEWELLKEKAKNRTPRPDMSLEDLVRRVRGKQDVFGPEHPGDIEVLRAFTRIEEHAAAGAITVFGVPGVTHVASFGNPDAVARRVPIPVDAWRTHSLSYTDFLQDKSGRVDPTDQHQRIVGGGYGNIWFDSRQIDSLWPTSRRRLNWRNPRQVQFKDDAA